MQHQDHESADTPDQATTRQLTPAAIRALAEAKIRRAAATPSTVEPEIQGRGGLEPVRFGDWEVKGLACDF